MRRSLLLLLLASALFVASAAGVQAQPQGLTISVVPDHVEIGADGFTKTLIVVRNPTTTTFHSVRLDLSSNARVDSRMRGDVASRLAPGESFAVSFWMEPSENAGPIDDTVTVVVRYMWTTEAGEPARGISTATLSVTRRGPTPVDAVADVQVQSALSTLNEQRTGTVYVVVHNVAQTPITVLDVVPGGPAFVRFEPAQLPRSVRLAPRETRAFPIEVGAAPQVQPGPHRLLFTVHLEWPEDGYLVQGNTVVTHSVSVGVLGESDILTALGVPSLLILPGFLMLAVVSLLWYLPKPKAAPASFPLSPTAPEFWVIAISLSFGMAFWGFPRITAWSTGTARTYLTEYGLGDVALLWSASMVVGVVLHLLILGGIAGYDWWLTRRRERHTPAPQDDPLTILRKLHRLGLTIELERLEINEGDRTYQGFALEPREDGQPSIWIGPAIEVRVTDAAEPGLREEIDALLIKKDAQQLAATLEHAQRTGVVGVQWSTSSHLVGPTRVPMDAVTPTGRTRQIVGRVYETE